MLRILVALVLVFGVGHVAAEDLVNKEGILGEDDRLTWPEFAAAEGVDASAVEELFAPVGKLNCSGMEGTAFLVARADVAVTAGHVFFDDQCNPVREPTGCFFYKNGYEAAAVAIEAATLLTGACRTGGHFWDWAVVRLQRPITNVQPFELPDEPRSLSRFVGMNVLNVTSMAVNYAGGSNVPLAMRCAITHTRPSKRAPLGADCDSGKGHSGSPLLIVDGVNDLWHQPLSVMGIMVAKLVGERATPEFLHLGNYNIVVPMHDKSEFLAAVRKTVDEAAAAD